MDGFADEEYFQTDEIIWIVVVVHLENYKKGSFNREILSRELFDFFLQILSSNLKFFLNFQSFIFKKL